MPELPEVETIKRSLNKSLLGKKIVTVKILRSDSIAYPEKKHKFSQLLCGQEFETIERRGKYLIFVFRSKACLVVHLRMSGRILIKSKNKTIDKHVRVLFDLNDHKQFIFEDMRVFGRLWFVPNYKDLAQIVPALSELGCEPLTDLQANVLHKQIKMRRQAIKSTLLDQRIIAGIGNIYADESLYLAGICPQTSSCELSLKQLHTLCLAIKKVLRQAIEMGGSTLRNYTNSEGINGNYQNDSLVYGRTGKPCKTCKNIIVRVRIAGRSAHYCPACQRE